MSYEIPAEPQIQDAADAEAPTERDPSVHDRTPGMPPRGVALSVLWWREGDVDDDVRG